MQTSKVMDGLREIRDENSRGHFSQMPMEFSKEVNDSVD